MTASLHDRITARLDVLQLVARSPLRTFMGGGPDGEDGASAVCMRFPTYALDVWLPSLRRRAERHRPIPPTGTGGYISDGDVCARCPDDYPCVETRDLALEIGVDHDA